MTEQVQSISPPSQRGVNAKSDEDFKPEPRLLTREQAANYCQCRLSTFDSWVRRGILPGPITGTHRWDRKAIDTLLDRASGLQITTTSEALDEWRAKRAGGP